MALRRRFSPVLPFSYLENTIIAGFSTLQRLYGFLASLQKENNHFITQVSHPEQFLRKMSTKTQKTVHQGVFR
jgi:hypothetical protein